MIVGGVLAIFTGPLRDGEKERNIYEKGETNRTEKGLNQKSGSLKRQTPDLKIETYLQQIGSKLWLAGRDSNGKAIMNWRGIEKRKIISWQDVTMLRRHVNTGHDNAKTAEKWQLHMGSHAYCDAEKTEIASNHVLELQQKTRKIIQVLCLFSLSRFLCFIYICLAKEIDSFHILFQSFWRQLKCVICS